MTDGVSLLRDQKEIMSEFYSYSRTKVVYTKRQRRELWDTVKKGQELTSEKMSELSMVCPALHHCIVKHFDSGDNVQSAIFSECAYAQTLANIFGLGAFHNCLTEGCSIIPETVMKIISSYSLLPRYAYVNQDESRMLIQAGGCGGVDSALITVFDLKAYTIEFKEPGAKTSEPDLPKYEEDGQIKITSKFLSDYPQFEKMLMEHRDLNFFEVMGHNINEFSYDSVNAAITNNYNFKKFADVVCTEDVGGYLVMLPINQVSHWAMIQGEIRPAGRNPYEVWTPNALRKFIIERGGEIDGTKVRMRKQSMGQAKKRGGNGKDISRLKITPLFFVRSENCRIEGDIVEFDFSDVLQLNPTIAGKMFFKKLKYGDVKSYYGL